MDIQVIILVVLLIAELVYFKYLLWKKDCRIKKLEEDVAKLQDYLNDAQDKINTLCDCSWSLEDQQPEQEVVRLRIVISELTGQLLRPASRN